MNKWTAVVIAAFGLFMGLLDAYIVNIAIPSIMQDFHTTIDVVTWVINSYVIALTVVMLLMGRLGDRFGVNRIYIIGLFIFVFGSLGCGLTNSLDMLILFRVLQGIGAAALMPNSMAIVTRAFPSSERGTALGVWGGIGAIASALGPTLGGLLTQIYGWHWIFLINVPVGIVGIVWAIWKLPRREETTVESFDWWGMIFLAISLLTISYGLLEGNHRGWSNSLIVSSFIVSALSLLLFLWIESRLKAPMIPFSLFKNRTFFAATIINGLAGASISGSLFLLPLYLVNLSGYKELEAGLLITPLALMIVILALSVGKLTDRFGAFVTVSIGIPILTIGVWLFSYLRITPTVGQVVISTIIVGVGVAYVSIPLAAASTKSIKENIVGLASGVFSLARLLGTIIGIAIVVSVLVQNMKTQMIMAKQEILVQVGSYSFPTQIQSNLQSWINDSFNGSNADQLEFHTTDIERSVPLQIPAEYQKQTQRTITTLDQGLAVKFTGNALLFAENKVNSDVQLKAKLAWDQKRKQIIRQLTQFQAKAIEISKGHAAKGFALSFRLAALMMLIGLIPIWGLRRKSVSINEKKIVVG